MATTEKTSEKIIKKPDEETAKAYKRLSEQRRKELRNL
jgi:hypothetical protein